MDGVLPRAADLQPAGAARAAARRADFDIVHDNQVLAYGILGIPRLGLPLVTSIHHPISVDRRIELKAARGPAQDRQVALVLVRPDAGPGGPPGRPGHDRLGVVPGRHLRDFRVAAENVQVIPLGVDTRLFHPRDAARVPGRIVAVASADSPVKGVATLLRAFAKLTVERDVSLTLVSKPCPAARPSDCSASCR